MSLNLSPPKAERAREAIDFLSSLSRPGPSRVNMQHLEKRPNLPSTSQGTSLSTLRA